MAGTHDKHTTPPEQRALTEERRATLRALELAATLGHFASSLDKVADEHAILAETASKLSGLVDFSSLNFYLVNEETFAFDLAWTSTPGQQTDIQREVDIFIEERTFAWALGRNKPTMASSRTMGRILLHPIATGSGPLGMFVGILRAEGTEHSADIGFYLLTITLFAASALLENFRLFRDLETVNSNLEQEVADRTRELTLSNTQLRETLDERERFRRDLETVFSSMQDPLITVDRNRRITKANRAAVQLFGAAEPLLTGRAFADAFPQAAEACLQVFSSTIDHGQAVREFRTQYRQEGMDRVLILSCSPLIAPDGSLGGAVLLIRDITRLASLEKQLKERHSFRSIVGKSIKMQRLYTLLESLTEVDTTVLVTGESGTGKELIADALHHNGARAHGPLIKVNCTALSESLLESELFGHVRGAFTGAVADKAGRFEAAEGGTIFLDEIGDVSPRIQVLLLRFLESKEFERVGDTVTRKADVRIVAATNANLLQKIQEGSFRADLYYRLNVMHVQLPPLRERRDDLPLLTTHLIARCNKELGTTVQGITDEAMQFFLRHPWPGNVRELKHVIEHGCILARQGLIGIEHLTPETIETPYIPPPSAAPAPYAPAPQPLLGHPAPRRSFRDLTAETITAAVAAAGGNKAHAARLLGMGRATLYRKMRELHLDD